MLLRAVSFSFFNLHKILWAALIPVILLIAILTLSHLYSTPAHQHTSTPAQMLIEPGAVSSVPASTANLFLIETRIIFIARLTGLMTMPGTPYLPDIYRLSSQSGIVATLGALYSIALLTCWLAVRVIQFRLRAAFPEFAPNASLSHLTIRFFGYSFLIAILASLALFLPVVIAQLVPPAIKQNIVVAVMVPVVGFIAAAYVYARFHVAIASLTGGAKPDSIIGLWRQGRRGTWNLIIAQFILSLGLSGSAYYFSFILPLIFNPLLQWPLLFLVVLALPILTVIIPSVLLAESYLQTSPRPVAR